MTSSTISRYAIDSVKYMALLGYVLLFRVENGTLAFALLLLFA